MRKTFYSTYLQENNSSKRSYYVGNTAGDDAYHSFFNPDETYAEKMNRKLAEEINREIGHVNSMNQVNNRLTQIQTLIFSLDTEESESSLKQRMVGVVMNDIFLKNVVSFTEKLHLCKQKTIAAWFEEITNFHMKFFKKHNLCKDEIHDYVEDFVIPSGGKDLRNFLMFASSMRAAQTYLSDANYKTNFFNFLETKRNSIKKRIDYQEIENKKFLRSIGLLKKLEVVSYNEQFYYYDLRDLKTDKIQRELDTLEECSWKEFSPTDFSEFARY